MLRLSQSQVLFFIVHKRAQCIDRESGIAITDKINVYHSEESHNVYRDLFIV